MTFSKLKKGTVWEFLKGLNKNRLKKSLRKKVKLF